ncbi:MAG: hypothetical protein PGN34_03280 [Methylobacterium frigidaeris]
MPEPVPAARGAGPSLAVAPASAGQARFALNAASNFAYLALSTVLMIWYVPYLMHHLGPATYGIVPLANSLVMYAGLVCDGLNTSVYRYLAINLGRGDAPAARRTFDAAAALTLLTGAVLMLPAAAVTWLFPTLFAVPEGEEAAARFLFASVCATMLTGMLGGLFGASSQITHRFDLRNAVRATALLLRVGLVPLCFTVWPASLWHVGAAFLASAVAGLACEVAVWRYLTPQLTFRPHAAEPAAAREFISLSGWSTVNMVGFLLLVQVDLVIVNALFGAEATGRYGALLLLPALVSACAEIVVPMLSPLIMAHYAARDGAGIAQLARRSVRLLGIALALPSGLVCGFGAPLLGLWLGAGFAELDLVLALLCGHLALNLALRPLGYVLTAYNRVRVQGLVSLGAGLANLLLALALARWTGWGIAAVAAAAAVVWTARNVVFLAIYSAFVIRVPWWSFIRPLAPGLAGLLAVTLVGRILTHAHAPSSWPALAAISGAVALAYAAAAYACLLTPADRRAARQLLRRRFDV